MTIDQVYKLFKEEANHFFVSEFIESAKIEKIYKQSIRFILDPNEPRGVIAYHSKYGQGKTFLFNVLHSCWKHNFNQNLFLQTSSKELVDLYKSKGEEELNKFIQVKNIFIDDIGAEVKDGSAITKNFGNSMNVVEYVIFKRYELWEKKGWKFHGSSNIDINQIAKIYGGRVADRMAQMTEILEFDMIATSFRQVKKVRPLTEHEKKVNLEKYFPKKKNDSVERVDMVKFLNDLIQDPEKETLNHDVYFWTFIRKYLERNDLIKYENITDKDLEAAELLARKSIRTGTEAAYKNLVVANREKKEAYNNLDYRALMNVAKNIECRKLILKKKELNEQF